jgi:hypothetical protein
MEDTNRRTQSPIRIWLKALVPTPANYGDILVSAPSNAIMIGLAWLAIAALVGFMLIALGFILGGRIESQAIWLALRWGSLLSVLTIQLKVLVYAKLGNWLAHKLEYKGVFEDHFYLYAAFFTPLELIISPVFTLLAAQVDWQPIVSFAVLSAPLHLYQYILGATANRLLYKASVLDSILITSPFLLGIVFDIAMMLVFRSL